jgi:hypothetical protein
LTANTYVHEDEPTMPPKRDKLAKADLDLIKRWIASGALETPNGTAPPVANPLAYCPAFAWEPPALVNFSEGFTR